MVSMLDSKSNPGSRAGCVLVFFWGKTLYLTVPLFTQEYKLVLANCRGRSDEMWGGVIILQVASGYRNLDEFQLDGPHGWQEQTWPFKSQMW